jgi:membrane-associated phospholipid phosphatase
MNKNKEERTQKPRTGSIVCFIVGLFIIVATAYVAHKHQLTGFQATVFHDINNENLPSSFTTAAKWITEGLGAGYPIALCVLVSLLFKKFKLAWRFIFVTGGAGVVADLILKPLVKEQRPLVLLHGMNLHARVFESDLGFPSGHATEATAMALLVWFLLPVRWRWLSVLWIVLVCWSRLYLGVHTPVDVIGGFGVGLAAVSFLRLLPDAIAKPLRLDMDDKHPIK